MSERDRRTGARGPMIALETSRGRGTSFPSHLRQHGFDERNINRRMAGVFALGSNSPYGVYPTYRPSDRAALLLDCAPELTPYAESAAS